LGSDGFVVQADVCKPDEIRRMFARVKSELLIGHFREQRPSGSADILRRAHVNFVGYVRFRDGLASQGVFSGRARSRPADARRRKDQGHGLPSDLGNAVALLCSAEANWITGQVLDVDGVASLMDAHLPLEIQQIPAAQAHATSF